MKIEKTKLHNTTREAHLIHKLNFKKYENLKNEQIKVKKERILVNEEEYLFFYFVSARAFFP